MPQPYRSKSMMINIQIEPSYKSAIPEDFLLRVGNAVLSLEKPDTEVEVTIVLTDDSTLRALNAQHLGIDAPTDVLSFPADEFDPDQQLPYIGDVIISVPRAEEQATAAGHPLENEISLLVVHGILHLLGYDHDTEINKTTMWEKQSKILAKLGIHINKLPE